MVNYGRLVCEVALLVIFLALTTAAPSHRFRQKFYDQRQKGGDNYRLSIDGVAFAVIPEEVFSVVQDSLSDKTSNEVAILEVLGLVDATSVSKPPQDSLSPAIIQAVEVVDKPKLEEKPLDVKPMDSLQEENPLVKEPGESNVLRLIVLEQKPLEETDIAENLEGFKKSVDVKNVVKKEVA